MTEAQFTSLVQGLRTEASHWFNDRAMLELEKLVVFAQYGFNAAKVNGTTFSFGPPSGTLDNLPSGV